MRLWLLLTLVFLLQEPISSSAVLLAAYQSGYSVWLIHTLFILATLFDCVVGYSLGRFIQDRAAGSSSPWAEYLVRKAGRLHTFVGTRTRAFSLMVYGPIIFPWSAIVAPWLRISMRENVIYFFIGELLFWYAPLWLVVLGVHTIFPNPLDAIYAVAGVSFLITLALRFFEKRVAEKSDTV